MNATKPPEGGHVTDPGQEISEDLTMSTGVDDSGGTGDKTVLVSLRGRRAGVKIGLAARRRRMPAWSLRP
jgi:hypothetical protein